MTVIASIHFADVGAGVAPRLRRPVGVPGLRQANVGIAAPLSASFLPRPMIGRAGLVAFWDSEAALDRFLADHPLGARFAGGWQARLEPLRAYGTWPGLPDDIARDRVTDHHGPAVVLTLGRLRIHRAIPFLRTSAKAEGAVVNAPGAVWSSGLARPPFVATCSVWESTRDLSTYAYGTTQPAHHNAIEIDRPNPFTKPQAFIRFRPISIEGSLGGRNPIAPGALTI